MTCVLQVNLIAKNTFSFLFRILFYNMYFFIVKIYTVRIYTVKIL